MAPPEIWGTGICGPEDPFSRPSDHSQDPPFQHFQLSSKISLALSYHKFLEILSSKASKLAKNSVPKPHIRPKFRFSWLYFVRISVHQGLYSSIVVLSQAPLFGPLGSTPILKLKLSAPLPQVNG